MTPDLLITATGCLRDDALRMARPIGDVLAQYQITGRLRVAAFLAQTAHESARYQRLVENLHYTDAERLMKIWPSKFPRFESGMPYLRQPERLANYVYAGRMGNGSEASGDGWAFRGRGLIQITGRELYEAFGADIGEPLAVHPDLVAQPAYAALSAAWYWKKIGANALADEGQFDRITRRINPAMAGAEDRRQLYQRAFRALEGVST